MSSARRLTIVCGLLCLLSVASAQYSAGGEVYSTPKLACKNCNTGPTYVASPPASAVPHGVDAEEVHHRAPETEVSTATNDPENNPNAVEADIAPPTKPDPVSESYASNDEPEQNRRLDNASAGEVYRNPSLRCVNCAQGPLVKPLLKQDDKPCLTLQS
eukprot:GILJ01038752.1.p1 GENE.GILJ01038752.1~~GILJ01038752.1.p1  ORF type:complete len:159 (-),score=20.55 GILJ01038752.1:102-578(-)